MRTHTTLLLLLAFTTGVTLSFAEGQIIELKNGTKLIGTIDRQEGGKAYITAELLGPVVVDVSALADPVHASAAVAATPSSDIKQPTSVLKPVEVASGAPAKTPHDPNKPIWKRMLSVSGSYTSASYVQGDIPGAPAGFAPGSALGLQGTQSTVQVSGMLLRATQTQAITLNGAYAKAKYEPAGTVVDNWSAEGTFTRILTPKTYVLTRSTYRVDKPSQVEHSFEQIVGYGRKLIDTDATHLDVIPGVSMVNEEKGTEFDNKWILSVGFLEHLDHAFNERVSIEQKFKYRIGVEDTEVWAINAYLGLKAALNAHWSFTVGATYNYDNTLGALPPSISAGLLAAGLTPAQISMLRPAKKDQLMLTSGIELDW